MVVIFLFCLFCKDYMLKELKADGLENVHGEKVQVSRYSSLTILFMEVFRMNTRLLYNY